MSNLSAIHAAALPSQLQDVAELIAQHGRPDRPPNLYASLQSLRTIDQQVFDYCGKIEALMKAMLAIINTSTETESSDTLRHLARLAQQRANLCREDVTAAVEEAGLLALDEDSFII
ncbi:MAG: hypothetical protein KKD97_16440 [Gammaproteobacteria bacterium]|nr:hypothetical protein [Gammaproteobacteria bacterium]